MTQFSDDRGDELRELFFETAQELLQSLNDEALRLEKHPDDTESVRSMRRTVHTLKGDAAACGFRELSELAHELEDALAVDAVPTHFSLAEIAFCDCGHIRRHARLLSGQDRHYPQLKNYKSDPGVG